LIEEIFMRRRKLALLGLIPLVILLLVGCANKATDNSEILSTAQIKKNIGSKLITTREDSQKKLTEKYQKITKKVVIRGKIPMLRSIHTRIHL
jgi:hypothetical protein